MVMRKGQKRPFKEEAVHGEPDNQADKQATPSKRAKQSRKEQARHVPSQEPATPNFVLLVASHERLQIALSAHSRTAPLESVRGDCRTADTATNKQAIKTSRRGKGNGVTDKAITTDPNGEKGPEKTLQRRSSPWRPR